MRHAAPATRWVTLLAGRERQDAYAERVARAPRWRTTSCTAATTATSSSARCGDDLVRGGQDDDVVEGGPGADLAYGDAGDDVVVGGSTTSTGPSLPRSS